jgi:chitinase
MGIGNMTNMLQTTITRGNFIASLILILRNFGFDGVCIDFFYPGHGKSPLGDKTLFTLLCKEMRVAFDEEAKRTGNQTLLMVVTVAGNKEIIDNGYELHDISECANFINLITYNLYNESDLKTEHHSALYPSQGLNPIDAQLNVEWVAKYCEEQGVPKNKIIIGMPLYGRTFTLKNASDDGIGAPIVGPGPAGECTQIPGLLSYTKICSLLTDSSATKVWMADAKVPYVSKDTLWVGYDDKESLETKVRWLVEKGYGGYWAWTGDYDDCKGLNCNQGPFPLMNTLHRTMMGSVTGSLPPLTKILESSTKSLTEITETETTGYEMSTPSGLPCEVHSEGLFPYPGNCTMYIQCSNHIAHDMPCPQGTYWDPVNLKCNWPSDLTEQRRKECDLH